MMDLRKRLFIILGIILGVLIALLLFFLLFDKKDNTPVEPTPENQTTDETAPAGTPPTPTPAEPAVVLPSESADQIYVRQLARIFVERSGSFSSQNDNIQLEDIRSIVTPRLATWLEQHAAEQKTLYEGTTTRVITTSDLKIDGDKASVRLGVQMEKRTNGTSKTEYKNGRVDMVKVGSEWKVDGIFWDA